MTAEGRQPFTRFGGIETWFARNHKAVIAEFNSRTIDVIPENEITSQYAHSLETFVLHDDTLKRTSTGKPWASFVRYTEDPNQEPGTLVERWAEYDSAFGLIRALEEHIAKAYMPGGNQHEDRIRAIRLTNQLLMRFQRGAVSEDEMKKLHDESQSILLDAHYTDSSHPDRVESASQILRATEPVVNGRPNLPNRRVILAAQRMPEIEDLKYEEVVVLKNLHRANEISVECDFSELALRAFNRRAREFAASRVGTGSFGEAQMTRFMNEAFYMLSPKSSILLQPYTGLAAKIRYGMFAKDIESGIPTLGRFIGLKPAIEYSDTMPTFNTLDSLEDKKERIMQLAHLGENGLNNLIEERRGGSKPKEPKPKRKRAIDKMWQEIDERERQMDLDQAIVI